MSAKVIPWPSRTVAAGKPVNYLPALIDRQVPVRALRKALAAAGLRLEHDLLTGNLFILPDSVTPAQPARAGGRGSLRSLHQFVGEKHVPLAVRFDTNPPSIQNVSAGVQTGDGTSEVNYRLLSLPLYLVEKVADVVRELAS